MNMGIEVKPHAFLTLSLSAGQWSPSLSRHFTHEEWSVLCHRWSWMNERIRIRANWPLHCDHLWSDVCPHLFYIFVGYLIMHSVARQYSVEWMDGRLMIIWKEFGRKRLWPNWGSLPAFAWRNWGKSQKTLSQDSWDSEHLTNMSHKHYWYTNLLVCCLLGILLTVPNFEWGVALYWMGWLSSHLILQYNIPGDKILN
jgi:hypothetical protein